MFFQTDGFSHTWLLAEPMIIGHARVWSHNNLGDGRHEFDQRTKSENLRLALFFI